MWSSWLSLIASAAPGWIIAPCLLVVWLAPSTAHVTTYSTSDYLATTSALNLYLRSAATVDVLNQARVDLSPLGIARDLLGSSVSSGSYAIGHDTLVVWSWWLGELARDVAAVITILLAGKLIEILTVLARMMSMSTRGDTLKDLVSVVSLGGRWRQLTAWMCSVYLLIRSLHRV